MKVTRTIFVSVVIIISIFVSVFSYHTFAAVPQFINYQSRLRDSNSNAIVTATTIQFSIYNHATNGSPGDSASSDGPLLWTETYDQESGSCIQIDPDSNGYFTVQLSTCNSFPSYLNFNSIPLYIGVKIGNDAEATPRARLGTVPFAFNTNTLDGIDSLSFLRSDTSDIFTSGTLTFNDLTILALGSSTDFTISHDGTNTVFDNTFTTGASIFQLGTDTSVTAFQILNNTGDNLFEVDGSGNVGIGVTDPEYKLEILDVSTQLLLSYSNGIDTELYTDSTGDLRIESSGGDVFISSIGGNMGIKGDIEMQDDQSLYFDTAKTSGIKYSSVHSGLFMSDDEFSVAGEFGIYSNTGIDASGDWEPYLKFDPTGYVELYNMTHGVNQYFAVYMMDGLKLYTAGSAFAVIKADNIATTDKTFQFPNIAGTLVTTAGALANVNLGAFDLMLSGSLGVGDTSPDALLEVVSSGNNNLFMLSKTVGGDGDVFIVDNSGNVGIGATTGPTANGGKVLFFGDNIADPTMDTNTAGIYAKDVSGTVEVFVVGEDDAITQISPHDPRTGEWIFYSKNLNTDRELRVEMEQLVKFIDTSFGTSFVYDSMLSVSTESTASVLTLDEEGSVISFTTESTEETWDSSIFGIFGDFVEKVKDALSWLGLRIENGIAQVKEIIVEKLTAKTAKIDVIEVQMFKMIDRKTDEVYCTWIEDGEWVKVKSSCDDLTNDQIPNEPEIPILETTTPSDQPVQALEWCDSSHLGLCDTQEKCQSIGLYWYGNQCHLQGEAVIEPILESQPLPEATVGEGEPILETTSPSS